MGTLQRTTVKEQVYSSIKSRILTQQYEMGERLNIDALAAQFKVSNSPVREAINMLEIEGLVVSSPNTGASVVSLSLRDMYELAQTIRIMQLGAYDYCVQHSRNLDLIPPMAQMLEKQHVQLLKRDLYQFIECANRFDRCILVATGIGRLIDSFDNVFSLFSLAALYDYQNRDTDWLLNIGEHEEILEAIRVQNHSKVALLISEHYNKPEWL